MRNATPAEGYFGLTKSAEVSFSEKPSTDSLAKSRWLLRFEDVAWRQGPGEITVRSAGISHPEGRNSTFYLWAARKRSYPRGAQRVRGAFAFLRIMITSVGLD